MADTETSTPQTSPDKPVPHKFRWRSLFRYRLRTLLVVMTLIAIWLGWWSHSARRQREAVAALQQAGTEVIYDFERSKLDHPLYWPTWLVDTLGIDYFAHVETIESEERRVTDAELELLEGLTNLDQLGLADTHITDAGLIHLQGLANLRILVLANTQVSDAGLRHLRQLTTLEFLFLRYTEITDAGLEHLKGLTNLYWLDLSGTQVTDAGVARLRKALPNCKIVH